MKLNYLEMKNVFLGLSLCLGVVLAVFSCKKETIATNTPITPQNHSVSSGFREKFYILYISWDPGKKSYDEEYQEDICIKRGICMPRVCAFCCVDEGQIVDCGTSQSIPYAGTIIYDDITELYELTFALDTSNAEHQYDIQHEIELPIEEDLVVGDSTNGFYIIKSGTYPFDPEVGNFGGYTINVEKQN